MEVVGDIESGSFPAIKLQNDGQIGFMNYSKLSVSKQDAIEWISKTREKIRPWGSFFATANYKVPLSAQRLPKRITKNIEYFQSNYVFVFIGLFLYCLITSPILLLAVLLSFSVGYWVISKNTERRIVILGHELTLTQQYSLVGLCSMPILYIAGAGSALFWVLGASCFLIMLHASFYDIQSLLDVQEESFELTMEQVV